MTQVMYSEVRNRVRIQLRVSIQYLQPRIDVVTIILSNRCLLI